MRKVIAVALVGVVLVSAWLVYSKVTQARREAAHRTALAPFQHDLRMGMDRVEVQKYLDSRRVDYHAVKYGGSDADTYEIKIGEEPGNLVCEHWTV
jgi:hypothetical protein